MPRLRRRLLHSEVLRVPASATPAAGGHDAIRDGTGGAGPSGLGQPSLPRQGREETSPLGVRDDPGLVPGLLCGVGAQSRHGCLHPVPRQRLRVSGRRAPPLPLRQCQGSDPGPRRGKTAHLEPADAGLCPGGGLRDQVVPAVSGPDQGQSRKRGEVRQGQHVAQHALHRRR